MSEVEREDILSQRLEEKQQLLDKRLLSQMVQQQRGGATDDTVAKAAKREEPSVCFRSSFNHLHRSAYSQRCNEGKI
jgi:hypothetical protein